MNKKVISLLSLIFLMSTVSLAASKSPLLECQSSQSPYKVTLGLESSDAYMLMYMSILSVNPNTQSPGDFANVSRDVNSESREITFKAFQNMNDLRAILVLSNMNETTKTANGKLMLANDSNVYQLECHSF